MFKRYTDECKRAIFLAQQIALHEGATAINSMHLLLGVLRETDSGADSIFRLCERLPEEIALRATLTKQQLSKGIIPLSTDGKRGVAYTADEANRLRDYWIDTEHLVLGILRESSSAAAKLRAIGLELEPCRQLVVSNKKSRPPRPDPVLWWVRHRPIGFVAVAMVLFALGVATALILFGFVAMGTAFAILAMIQVLRAVAKGYAT